MKSPYFPGHVAAAHRTLATMMAAADVVLQVRDARAPLASAGRVPGRRGRRQSLVVVLNKSDLADPVVTDRWVRFFDGQGQAAVAVDSRGCGGVSPVLRLIDRAGASRAGSTAVAVTGLPNVGKSSLINCLAGRARAKRGDMPGVTRVPQWITTGRGIRVLDTPGVTFPGELADEMAWTLASIGVLPEGAIDPVAAATWLISRLPARLLATLRERYGVNEYEVASELLVGLARRRGLLGAGGIPLVEQAALVVLRDFRQGRLGQCSLEIPPEDPVDGHETPS